MTSPSKSLTRLAASRMGKEKKSGTHISDHFGSKKNLEIWERVLNPD